MGDDINSMKCGIVVIGYNRSLTIERLLVRLNQVEYLNDEVLLIISIDKSDTEEVYRVVDSFKWKHGKCIRKYHEENLGLRNHILKCGTYMKEYDLDAIAVFEDDIYPSRAFYNYMKQAVNYYQDSEQIAGISLYTHLWNVNASLPFQPDYNGYDIFFMQYAQSWGQIWLRKQWQDFMDWYETHQGKLSEVSGIPASVCNWPESSWLKYHIAYCVDKQKYFVYPYEALATCFNEAGTHTKQRSDIFQVPLMENSNKIYTFQPLESIRVSYDVFFEREQVDEWMGIPKKDLCIDLYGQKNDLGTSRYLLTMKTYPYEILDTYGLEMRPHEINVLERIPGNDIILYDLRKKAGSRLHKDESDQLAYYFRIVKSKVWYIRYGFVNGIKKLKLIVWRRISVRWRNRI